MGPPVILNGWKEIAAHIGRGVRTIQRWESLGLPIRRPKSRMRSAVIAFAAEVDAWLKSAAVRDQSDPEPMRSTKSSSSSEPFRARILIVDDDEALLVTTATIVSAEGYEVRTARDGFEALAVLRGSIPDLLISDLKMPNMSGFELLSVVRKRFPGMAVIALSGEFAPVTSPLVIADRFLQKGKDTPEIFKETIRELLSLSPIRVQPTRYPAPAWVPKSTNGYVVMVCSECLRPFAVPIGEVEIDKQAAERCVHCGQDFSYFIRSIETPVDVVPPVALIDGKQRIDAARGSLQEVEAVARRHES